METAAELTRAEVESMRGPAILEFGASWCPICEAARPLIDSALDAHPGISHRWIEDGKGKPLGRFFRVKLWPTLVFLNDGQEVARVVRPNDSSELQRAFELLRR